MQRGGQNSQTGLRKTLGPEPSGCLQDRARGGLDPWFAAESGSGRSYPGGSRDTAPVAGIRRPLFATVVADLAINRIRSNFAPMIFAPSLPPAIRSRTNGLLRMKARSAEGTMAKSARPLNHAPRVARFRFN